MSIPAIAMLSRRLSEAVDAMLIHLEECRPPVCSERDRLRDEVLSLTQELKAAVLAHDR